MCRVFEDCQAKVAQTEVSIAVSVIVVKREDGAEKGKTSSVCQTRWAMRQTCGCMRSNRPTSITLSSMAVLHGYARQLDSCKVGMRIRPRIEKSMPGTSTGR